MDTKEPRFAWLHLSDLHCGLTANEHLWPRHEAEFLEDMAFLHANSGPWDVIFFTGDLTQRGSKEEFRILDENLRRIYDRLSKLGSTPFLIHVPGNHDLVRPDPASPEAKLLARWRVDREVRETFWTNSSSRYRVLIMDAFRHYTDWAESNAFPKPPKFSTGMLPGDFSAVIEKDGTTFGVVGLNSTFLQLDGKKYKEKLALDIRQFNASLGAVGGIGGLRALDFSFLLTHHPPAWFDRATQDLLDGEIYPPKQFTAHLFGHEHAHEYRNTTIGGAAPRRHWQALSLFGMENYGNPKKEARRHGYAAGVLELTEGGDWAARVFPRRAEKHQAGYWQIKPDQTFTLRSDEGTEPEVVRKSPTRKQISPSKRTLTVLLLATDVDLGDAKKKVGEHLRRTLGVHVEEASTVVPTGTIDVAILLLGWWWDGGVQADLWQTVATRQRVLFASHPDSDWPPRRLTEWAAKEAIERYRIAHRPTLFHQPENLPEVVAEFITEVIHERTGTENLGLAKWERAYLEIRLPAWKAGRTAASRVHLLDSENAEELYDSGLYTPLDGVTGRYVKGDDGHPKRLRKAKKKDEARLTGELDRRVRLAKWLAVADLPRIVIVGAPGGGKTVFLTRVAAAIGNACLGRPVDLEADLDLDALRSMTGILPIPVVLEATRIAKIGIFDVSSIVEALIEELGAGGADRPMAATVTKALEDGRYFLFIDALDEIAEAAHRTQVLDLLKGIGQRYPNLRIVLTTRSARYTGALRFGPEFEVVEVAPLSRVQVERLCSNWTEHRTRDEEYRQALMAAVGELADQVGSAPEDQALTENPLMLTAICMLFERYRSLPDDRGRLCDLLVDDLCRSRRSEDSERHWKLDDAMKKDLLQRIALRMQEEGAQSWPVARALEIVVGTLPINDEHRPQRAKRYLDWTADHTGLLRFQQMEDGHEQVRFWHRLFREYLSANRLAQVDNTASEKMESLWAQGRLVDPFWEDVVRLLPRALGTIEKAKSVYEKLSQLAESQPPHRGRLLGLLMAAVIENRDLYPDVHFENTALTMARVYEAEGMSWALRDRLLFLDGLGRIDPRGGDPRVTDDKWIDVVRNPVDRKHGRPVDYMSVAWAPVTVQEFRTFVESADAEDPKFWTEYTTPRQRFISRLRAQFRYPNRPIVDIAFSEAVAYCRWLTSRRADGLIVRLLNRSERLALDALFPRRESRDLQFGDRAIANWSGAGIGHPSPVGAFPPDHLGLVDLVGNVWEWVAEPTQGETNGELHLAGGAFDMGTRSSTRFPTIVTVRETANDAVRRHFMSVGMRCVLARPVAADGARKR